MQPPLTASQQRFLIWVEDFMAQHGMAPTYREIQKGLGYRSPASVQLYIDALTAKRLISHAPRKSRSLKLLRPSDGIPLIGAIAAHSLVETFPDQEQQRLELSCLPKLAHLSQHERSQHFALHVRGDSMTGALIDHGDVVIMRRETNPRAIRNGTIVAARKNGTTTLKYLYRHGQQVTLQPANSVYEPTVVDMSVEELEIQGVYVGLLRGLV
ncbi:MAG: transcriptional repressor LexA [Lyngbya sp. HA4199-MV5]|jgi:repressor LexA|nr:transcriptional repressor LexA [Lyngbya sp. HA4199-MV5]